MSFLPVGGYNDGFRTPKRRYSENEETRIHHAVPSCVTLRELSVGTSHIKRLLTELSVSLTQLYNKVRSLHRYSPNKQGRKRTTPAQRAIIIDKCESMIQGGPRTADMVAESLKEHAEILNEFTYIQLSGIIDYEKMRGGGRKK